MNQPVKAVANGGKIMKNIFKIVTGVFALGLASTGNAATTMSETATRLSVGE